ncbi:MAG: hypothetical protein KAJ29_04705 [Alphaproteobacteria bacterium]|nr:hypothetical protein [Alphaproteobacteria bacterium]
MKDFTEFFKKETSHTISEKMFETQKLLKAEREKILKAGALMDEAIFDREKYLELSRNADEACRECERLEKLLIEQKKAFKEKEYAAQLTAAQDSIEKAEKATAFVASELEKKWEKAAKELIFLSQLVVQTRTEIRKAEKNAVAVGLTCKVPHPEARICKKDFWRQLEQTFKIPDLKGSGGLFPRETCNEKRTFENLDKIATEVQELFSEKNFIVALMGD